MFGTKDVRAKLQPRSQVLIYELQFKEVFDKHQRSPHPQRAQVCFNVFDDLLKYSGVLQPILRIIRDELYRSVYSQQLTSSMQEPYVERIPFFEAVGRLDDAQVEQTRLTNDTISHLQQQLKFREHDLKLNMKKNLVLKQDIIACEKKIAEMQEDMNKLSAKLVKLDGERTDLKNNHHQTVEMFQNQIRTMESSLEQANQAVEKLSVFKGELNDQTISASFNETSFKANHEELVIDSHGIVEYDLHQCERLLEQFAEILNQQIDDYEFALIQFRKRQELFTNKNETEEDSKKERGFKLELKDLQDGFKQRTQDLLQEQELLVKHIQGLKIVQKLSQHNVKSSIKRYADDALRKYAVTMSLSTDAGKSFVVPKEMIFCGKCGERTVMCPHKPMNPVAVVLPPNATHVKFTHPPLRLHTILTKKGIAAPSTQEEAGKSTTHVDLDDELESSNLELPTALRTVWRRYYREYHGKRQKMTRYIPLSKIYALVREVFDARWAVEEESSGGTVRLPSHRFDDYFYQFMERKYLVKEISLKTVYDLIMSVQTMTTEDNLVSVFMRTLAGEMEATWKYFYLVRKFIMTYPSFDIHVYRLALKTIFAGRTRELYDQLELEYVAFSKNTITADTFENHLMHLSLAYKEPNYLLFYRAFQRLDYYDQGTLSYQEYEEVLSQILPEVPIPFKQEQYKFAELSYKHDEVPLERLAEIGAYTAMFACFKAN